MTEFNSLVLNHLAPLFNSHGLLVIRELQDQLTFRSERVVIKLVHNKLENSNALYAAKDTSFLYPIDEKLVKTIFNTDVKIDFVLPEVFVKNLVIFFENEGRILLEGNDTILKAIEEYIHATSKRYTNELVNKQNLEAADKAWKESDYSTFIQYIQQTDKEYLSPAYELKYKMAVDKLSK